MLRCVMGTKTIWTIRREARVGVVNLIEKIRDRDWDC